MNDENLFSASEVDRVLGYTRQTIHKQLDSIPGDGEKLMSGNRTKAWKIESLRRPIVTRLENLRKSKGYAKIKELLRKPFKRFALRVQRAQIRRSAIDAAQKRQRAFRDILPLRHDKAIRRADFVERGLAAYKREFGYGIRRKYLPTLVNPNAAHDGTTSQW